MPGAERSPFRLPLGETQVGIGSTAAEVLEGVSSQFSKIKAFSYVGYEAGYEFEISSEDLRGLPRGEVSYGRLRRLSERFPSPNILGIASKVLLKDGTLAHIPMMDLDCKKTEENLEIAVEALSHHQGFVLDSGRSYHFWGLALLNQDEWLKFLDYCARQRLKDGSLMFDEIHIELSKERGFSVLRIFDYPYWKPVEPRVVRILE